MSDLKIDVSVTDTQVFNEVLSIIVFLIWDERIDESIRNEYKKELLSKVSEDTYHLGEI